MLFYIAYVPRQAFILFAHYFDSFQIQNSIKNSSMFGWWHGNISVFSSKVCVFTYTLFAFLPEFILLCIIAILPELILNTHTELIFREREKRFKVSPRLGLRMHYISLRFSSTRDESASGPKPQCTALNLYNANQLVYSLCNMVFIMFFELTIKLRWHQPLRALQKYEVFFHMRRTRI